MGPSPATSMRTRNCPKFRCVAQPAQRFSVFGGRRDTLANGKPPNSGILFRVPMAGATVAAHDGVLLRERKAPA